MACGPTTGADSLGLIQPAPPQVQPRPSMPCSQSTTCAALGQVVGDRQPDNPAADDGDQVNLLLPAGTFGLSALSGGAAVALPCRVMAVLLSLALTAPVAPPEPARCPSCAGGPPTSGRPD